MTNALLAASAAFSSCIVSLPIHADAVRDDQWYLSFLKITAAHQHSRGDGLVVAVVDSGVDANHPDIRLNVLEGTDIVPGGAGDGRRDDDGHGTGMASLIAGHGRGSSGILGVASRARILPVRVETKQQLGDTNDGAKAITWAADHGARVICVAWSSGPSLRLLQSVEYARLNDVVVVAAAGNRPESTGVGAPASFPGVVAAAAVDRAGNHYPNSVTGPEIVLAAPGVDIVSASKNGGYRDGSGTSDAAAIIAGAAALVRARFPTLSAEEVIHRLTATADDRGPTGRDEQYGYGVLNLVAALTADVPPLRPTDQPPTRAPTVSAAAPPVEHHSSTTAVTAIVLLLLLAAGAVVLTVARRRGSG